MSELHTCVQATNIELIKKDVSFLQQNHHDAMQELREMKNDMKEGFLAVNSSIDEIKVYMFQGGMDSKYAKKESVAKLWRIVWSIIGFFAIAIGGVLTSKLFK